MADNKPSSLIPYRPPQAVDPYPERPNSLGGVRQTTQPPAIPARVELPVPAAAAPTSFAASFQPLPEQRRRFATPIASAALTILGQSILATLLATRTVDPVVGLLVLAGWMLCGAVLITAECVSQIRNQS